MSGLIWKPLALMALATALGTALWAVLIHGPAQHRAGVKSEQARALAALNAQMKERADINVEVDTLDDAGLCRALGGVFADGECR